MFKVLMLNMGFISRLRQDFFLFSRVVLWSLYLKSSFTCSYAATTNCALEVRLSECAVYNSRKNSISNTKQSNLLHFRWFLDCFAFSILFAVSIFCLDIV